MSGYLYHGRATGPLGELERDARVGGGAAAAAGLGGVRSDELRWLRGDRHIRTAMGRDYADVPPTHGHLSRAGGQRVECGGAGDAVARRRRTLDQEMPVPEDWSMLVEKAQAAAAAGLAPAADPADATAAIVMQSVQIFHAISNYC